MADGNTENKPGRPCALFAFNIKQIWKLALAGSWFWQNLQTLVLCSSKDMSFCLALLLGMLACFQR